MKHIYTEKLKPKTKQTDTKWTRKNNRKESKKSELTADEKRQIPLTDPYYIFLRMVFLQTDQIKPSTPAMAIGRNKTSSRNTQ